MKELMKVNTELQLFSEAELTRVGLALPSNITQEDWEKIGTSIDFVSNSIGFWLGDWLVAGCKRFGLNIGELHKVYPPTTELGLVLQEYATNTLYVLHSVAKALPAAYRYDNHHIRWAHCKTVVTALKLAHETDPQRLQALREEAKNWLIYAADKKLTYAELRHCIAGKASIEDEAEQTELSEVSDSTKGWSPSAFAKSVLPLAHRIDRELTSVLSKMPEIEKATPEIKAEYKHIFRPLLEKFERLLDTYEKL